MNNYLIWSFIKPSQWLFWAAIVGIVLYRRPLGRNLLLGVAVAIVACSILPLGALLSLPLEARFPPATARGVPDGIVVLAGGELAALSEDHADTQLNSAGDRLTTFLRLAHRYPGARLVHAGGAPGADGTAQSTAAKRLIYGVGIDAERILFSDQSRNTCEDARMAAERVRPRSSEKWLLVTSAIHMPRAVACFRAANWDVTAYPTDYKFVGRAVWDYAGLSSNLAHIDLAAHEWIGLVFYRLSGRTRELFAAP